MLCKRCKEHIEVGEPVRAEPTAPGSPHHVYYHPGCYSQVKEERQRRPTLEEQAYQARSVC